MKLTSHIATLLGPRQLEFRTETLDLDALGPRDLAAQTIVSVISPGTEMAAYRGDPPLRPMKVYPRVLGYCNIARVLRCGDELDSFAEGDLILSFQSHRSAFVCREGQIIAKLPERNGKEWTTYELAAMACTYLFHLGYNALLRCEHRIGDNVLVLGLGALGMTTATLAGLTGSVTIGLTDRAGMHRDILEECGARVLPKPRNEDYTALHDAIADLTKGTGIDICISTSNRWEDWRTALELTRRGGRIGLLGFPGRDDPIPNFNPLDSRWLYDKQLRISACGFSPDLDVPPFDLRHTVKRNCAYLLHRIIKGRLPAQALLAGCLPWRELDSLYQRLEAREQNFVTAALNWSGAE